MSVEIDKLFFKSMFVTVARTSDVPAGEARAFEVGDHVIAIFQYNGQFYAIDDNCPHMGASLAAGCVAEYVVTCPWHGWRFDIRDGTWRDSPNTRIPSFPLRVVGDEIQVELPDRPSP